MRLSIPSDVRANFPIQVRPFIEEHVEVEGELEVQIEDYYQGSRVLYFLLPSGRGVDRAEERLSLHFAAEPPKDLQTGTRIRVQAIRVDEALALGSGQTDIETLAAIQPNTFGEQKTAVILVNFQDKPTQAWLTPAQAQSVVFDQNNANSVTNFDWENSYHQTWLSGDVYGSYVIPVNSTVCDYSGIATYARQAAIAQVGAAKIATYSRFVYAFPSNVCGWWGLGTVGGNPSSAWINGSFQTMVVAHEMGHNFGLYHSHALDCGSVVFGGTCTSIEYGDYLDTMGSPSTVPHFNAVQKEYLGWLNYGISPPITTVLTSGVYSLDPMEPLGGQPRALKIARLSGGEYYYVEFRQPIGFDSFLSSNTNVKNGVVIHYVQSLSSRNSVYLLDMTPQTSSWYDPALDLNLTYTDSAAGITITPVWINGTAGVNVTLNGGPSCVRANPTVTLSPAQSQPVKAGTLVTYTVSAKNNDSTACGIASFNLQKTVPSGWTSVLGVSTLSLTPGASGTTTLNVTSPGSANPGSYPLSISMTNASYPTYTASGSAQYIVVAQVPSFADTFDRSDSTTLGNGWVEVKGDLVINANELKNGLVGDNVAVLPGITGSTLTAAASFASVDNNGAPRFGVVLGYKDPLNYYILYRQTGGTSRLYICKVVNGVEKVLKYLALPNPAKNTFFRLEGRVSGTTLKLFLDGVEKLSVSDTTYTAGPVGILLGSKVVKSCRADNFNATAQ